MKLIQNVVRSQGRFIKPCISHCQRSLHEAHGPIGSSVNEAEVGHFRNLAASWWDPHGPSRLLHLMNPLRHDFIATCHATNHSALAMPTDAPSRTLRYLDVGCGGGIFAESAARLAQTASVTAIDPTPQILDVAIEHARQDPQLQEPGRLQYLHRSIEQMPIPRTIEEQADVLSVWEVIEHVQQPSEFLRACMPFVKPGGWLVLSTIARSWTSWLTTKVMAEHVVGIVPRGTHDWSKYINPSEMTAFFETEPGWTQQLVQGCLFIPGWGWKMAHGSEDYGNYFFGVRKDPDFAKP